MPDQKKQKNNSTFSLDIEPENPKTLEQQKKEYPELKDGIEVLESLAGAKLPSIKTDKDLPE